MFSSDLRHMLSSVRPTGGMLTLRVKAVLTIALLAMLVAATPAFAYDELSPSSGKSCASSATGRRRDGPPRRPSRRRARVRTVATPPARRSARPVTPSTWPRLAAYVLLPAATIKDTCNSCHDGTGGNGVYGVVEARTGGDPGAEHRTETTCVDPWRRSLDRWFPGSYVLCRQRLPDVQRLPQPA